MGDTPPVLVAVDPDILQDVTGFQGVAEAYAGLLRRAPALLLIEPPEFMRALARNQEFPSQELIHRVGAFHVDPQGPLPPCPEGTTARAWLNEAFLQVMQHHIHAYGLTIPVVKIPVRNAASILSGGTKEAVSWARSIGANRIEVWSPHDYIDPTMVAKADEGNIRVRVLDPRPEPSVQLA